MGACLATKRTTAEKLAEGVDPDALVYEPYANPFRTYPLVEDYEKFKYFFEEKGVDCYIINTGHFLDKKIPKEVTIEIIEAIVEGRANFVDFDPINAFKMMRIPGFEPDFSDPAYTELIKKQMDSRILYVTSLKETKGGRDELPDMAARALMRAASNAL
jgi:phosphoenolpyruvate carboxykinase (ATP)